jgi:hypothetical protein
LAATSALDKATGSPPAVIGAIAVKQIAMEFRRGDEDFHNFRHGLSLG